MKEEERERRRTPGRGERSLFLRTGKGRKKTTERERRWLFTSPKYPTSSNTRRTKLPLDIKLN